MRTLRVETRSRNQPYEGLSEDALLVFMFTRALRKAKGAGARAVLMGRSLSLMRDAVSNAGLSASEYYDLTDFRAEPAVFVLADHTVCKCADWLADVGHLRDALIMLHGYLRHLNTCYTALQTLREVKACTTTLPVGPGFLTAVPKDVDREFVNGVTNTYLSSLREGPMPVSFNTAKLLYVLARSLGGLMVEVGTGRGFSTAWLAAGVRESGGEVLSFEAKEVRVREAKSLLNGLGLSEVVEVIGSDFRENVHSIAGRRASLIFIDGAKEEYLDYLRALESAEVIGEGTLILAHNTVSHIRSISPYIEAVYGEGYVSLTTMTDQAGLTITLALSSPKRH